MRHLSRRSISMVNPFEYFYHSSTSLIGMLDRNYRLIKWLFPLACLVINMNRNHKNLRNNVQLSNVINLSKSIFCEFDLA